MRRVVRRRPRRRMSRRMTVCGRVQWARVRPPRLHLGPTRFRRTLIAARARRPMLRTTLSTLRWAGLAWWPIVARPAVSVCGRLRRARLMCLFRPAGLLRIKTRGSAEQGRAGLRQRWPGERRAKHDHKEEPKLRLVQRDFPGLFVCSYDVWHDGSLLGATVVPGVLSVRPCHALDKCNPYAKALRFVCNQLYNLWLP